MWAVLPFKGLSGAKERLAGVLSPDERRGLAEAMVEDVLTALSQVTVLEGIAVVSPAAEAETLASRYGARLIAESEARGHTAAVVEAANRLAGEGVTGLITVPGDVPLATPEEIGRVLALHGAAPAMTIVPSRDERGSNCIACSPPDVLPFRFLAAARRLGLEPHICPLPGLGLDIDTPEDLDALLARPAKTRAHAYLRDSGIASRLAGVSRPDSHIAEAAPASPLP
jgi:2-phospho-L-lactate guanylyltransferase